MLQNTRRRESVFRSVLLAYSRRRLLRDLHARLRLFDVIADHSATHPPRGRHSEPTCRLKRGRASQTFTCIHEVYASPY